MTGYTVCVYQNKENVDACYNLPCFCFIPYA